MWQHVHNCADIHGYRAEYATAIYKAHARAIEEIPYDRVNRGTGGVIKARFILAEKMKRGRSWTKLPCWFAARRWGITESVL